MRRTCCGFRSWPRRVKEVSRRAMCRVQRNKGSLENGFGMRVALGLGGGAHVALFTFLLLVFGCS